MSEARMDHDDLRHLIDHYTGDHVKRRTQGRINRKAGEMAQEIVEEFMRDRGYQCIERIETGFGVIRRGRKLVGAFAQRRVSGDIKAIAHGGKAVHVEVKHRPRKADGRLVLQISDFEPHQLDALHNVTNAGGIAYVAWVVSLHPAQLYWLRWPFPIAKGRALTNEQARQLAFININEV